MKIHDAEDLEKYRKTSGNPTKCKKLCAIIHRRLIVFKREPRQWFLIFAPFLNIANIILIFQAIEKLLVATDYLDVIVSEEEEAQFTGGNRY
jgi:hypothetical protein